MIFYHASDIEGLRKILPLSESKNKEEKDKVAYFTTLRLCALSFLRDKKINHDNKHFLRSCIVTGFLKISGI